MSLIHWWPLNGNTNDYGINNVALINNGATVNSVGKIGKCYSFNNNNMVVATSDITSAAELSLCLWLKLSTSHSGYAQVLVLGTSGTSWNNIRCGIDTNGDGRIYFNVSSGSANTLIYSPLNYKDNIWHHITGIYNNGSLQLYIDGIQVAAGTTTNVPGLSGTSIYVGGNAGGEKANNGDCLNDIRIYNHALSAKEVKEISKGLMLHYNFEDCVNPNLFINSDNYTSASKATTSLASRDGYQSWPIYCNNLVNGTTYTLSVDFDGVLSPRHGIQATPENRYCTIWLYFQDSNYTDSSYSSYTNPVCFTSGSVNHKQLTATRHQWTFTLGSDLAYYKCCAIRTNTYSDGSTPVTVNFWNFKLEKSNTSTVFSTNAENTAIVYDNSGYGNNGTINNSLQVIPGGLSGVHYINLPLASTITYTSEAFNKTELTYSIWFRHHGANGSNVTYMFTNGRADYGGLGYGIQIANDSQIVCRYGNSTETISNCSKDVWHLITVSIKNAVQTIYLDGALVGSFTATVLPSYSDGKGLGLGCFYYNGGSIYHSNCDFADFKIYSTALSADDIKVEYSRKAAIDKKGNLFTGEFIETNTNANIADKNNQIKATYFVEGKDKVKIFGGYTELDYFDQINPAAGATAENNRCQISDINYDHIEARVNVTGQGTAGGIVFGNGNWWKTYTGQGAVNDGSGTVTMTPASFSQNAWTDVNWDFSKVFSGLWTSGWGGSPNVWTPQNLKVAYIKTYINSELTGLFIPVKNKNNVIGLFNLITNKFYSNTGTGTEGFVAGNSLGKLSLIQENKIEEL